MKASENRIIISHYKSKFGELLIGDYQGQLCVCDWQYRKMRSQIDDRMQTGLNANYIKGNTSIIDSTIEQLEQYFAGDRKNFDVPLKLLGTEFQKEVWKELLKIPFGVTETYLGLSRKMNNEGAIRAIASANGANAISIIVPCHRIIGSDGKLVGYAGGLETKKKLLLLENAAIPSDQLTLFP